MRAFITIVGLLALAMCSAPVAAAAQAVQIKTVYEDMRLICGTENSTEYRVRVMQAASKERASLKKQGFGVMTIRLKGSDTLPDGIKGRTRTDCAFD